MFCKRNLQYIGVELTHFIPTTTVVVVTLSIPTTTVVVVDQGSTLAMCPLARMHFLGRRASSGYNNSFYAGPRGQWLSDRWQTHVPVPVFSVDASRAAVRWFDLQVFSSRVILPVRTSIKTWLTNSIRHVTKLLMPKLNN